MVQKKIKNKNFWSSLKGVTTKKGKTKARLLINLSSVLSKKTKLRLTHTTSRLVRLCVPRLEMRSVRSGRSSYSVPFPTSQRRSVSLALRRLNSVCASSRGSAYSKLKKELINILLKKSNSLKERHASYINAQKNRAHLHYRWY
jgi:ribosomal protein S7